LNRLGDLVVHPAVQTEEPRRDLALLRAIVSGQVETAVVWDALVSSSTDLYPAELIGDIEQDLP
jgi:hypothetical protein